jgi:hypothetical protein
MKMNSIFRLLFSLIVVWAAIPAAAQEKVIDRDEYISAYQGALKMLKEQAYRSTRTYSWVYEGEVPNAFYTDMDEFVPPDRRRNVFVGKAEKGTQRTERITIGDTEYVRKDDEPCTMVREVPWNAQGVGKGSGTGTGKGMKDSKWTVEFKSIGGEKIRGEDAKLYQRREVMKYAGTDGKPVENITTRREWYNKDGLFLKTEIRIQRGTGQILHHAVSVYEYGPQIKIEAPVVEPANAQ